MALLAGREASGWGSSRESRALGDSRQPFMELKVASERRQFPRDSARDVVAQPPPGQLQNQSSTHPPRTPWALAGKSKGFVHTGPQLGTADCMACE